MNKTFIILLVSCLVFTGCSSKKDQSNTPQIWVGVYEHNDKETTTKYILTYNVKNEPPKLLMSTIDKDGKNEISVRELEIIDKHEKSVVLAPSDVYGTSQYDENLYAIVFRIHNELQAEITSVDGEFVLPMVKEQK